MINRRLSSLQAVVEFPFRVIKEPLIKSCCNLIPEAKLHIIKDSGHGTPVDQMAAFNDVVEEFLSR